MNTGKKAYILAENDEELEYCYMLRKTRGNLDYFGDIQKMKNSLRVELLSSNAAIYYIKHLDSHCIFTTILGTIALVKKGP